MKNRRLSIVPLTPFRRTSPAVWGLLHPVFLWCISYPSPRSLWSVFWGILFFSLSIVQPIVSQSIPVVQSVQFKWGTSPPGPPNLTNAFVPKPAGTQDGDLLIITLMVGHSNTLVVTDLTGGWIPIDTALNTNDVIMMSFWKIAAGEPDTNFFELSGNAPNFPPCAPLGPRWMWAMGCVRITGHHPTMPIHAFDSAMGDDDPVVAPSVTTTVSNCLILCYYSNNDSDNYDPHPMTTLLYDETHSCRPSNMLASFGLPIPGASGDKPADPQNPIDANWVAQQIAIRPACALTATCPPDLVLEGCDQSVINVVNTGFDFSTTPVSIDTIDFIAAGGTIMANCPVTITYVDTIIDMGCPPNPLLTVMRTFTISDDGGNTEICDHQITVEDTEAPVLMGVPNDITVTWCMIPDTAVVTGSDNCTLSPTVTFSETPPGTCSYVFFRNWSTSDACGNVTDSVQMITVIPPAPPVYTNPPLDTIILTCVDASNYNPGALSYTNGETGSCLLSGSVSLEITGSFDICGGEITYTWDTTLQCGFSLSHTQTVMIILTPAPTFSSTPNDTTINCTDVNIFLTSVQPLNFSNGETGVCEMSGSVSPQITQNYDACSGSIIISWDTTLSCMHSLMYTQTITILPAPPPSFLNPPVDTSVSCEDMFLSTIPDLFYSNGASMLCLIEGNVAGTQSGTVACGSTVMRTWMYSDSCGNIIAAVQNITIQDTIPPVPPPSPIDEAYECITEVPPPSDLTAVDNCDGNITVTGIDIQNPAGCGYIILRTWTFIDSCGNTSSTSQNITVTDNMLPVISCPPDNTFACNGDVLPAFTTYPDFITGGGSASDNCGLDESTFAVTETDNGTCPRTITRTYEIADSCDNVSQCVQTITVGDLIPPVINCPADVSFACNGDVPPAFTTYPEFIAGGGSASDNCGLDESTF
ncbi:MAG TPA: hypothetical protein VI603_14450, partial [Saprospiraceae bacterium]|nr:hypothetical protein [Saprospiraceae bacterium]